MLEVIEKLLILQDRDRKLHRLRRELEEVAIERQSAQTRSSSAQTKVDQAKLAARHLESERKKLELEVEAKKSQIEKYASQQLQTKKNEEYRALAHEIETCKQAILKLDDAQIEFMEKAEVAQHALHAANKELAEAKSHADKLMADLGVRESNLKKELEGLASSREALAGAVEEGTRGRYERLLKHKGENAVVGVDRRACGGCHMKLPFQIIVSCQGQQEVMTCPNCGRILYYTREMLLEAAD
ncbi:MAG: hypothetical protein FJ404_11685 [Verrucomicrobia bacterium]|nr:hypothetical protein [Verrucomicrobiota bacterium]